MSAKEPQESFITKHQSKLASFLSQPLLLKVAALTMMVIVICLTATSVLLLSSRNELSKKLGQKTRDFEQKSSELKKVTSEDQFVKNKELELEIKNIHDSFKAAATAYELLSDYQIKAKNTSSETKAFANILNLLSSKNFASAISEIASLAAKIKTEQDKLLATTPLTIGANLSVNNSPPSSGFSRQKVHTDIGDYIVDIVSADLASTRVIVDSASDDTCTNNCPALPLSDYVSRSGAFAGVNGTYFCPADYPSCAGKTNSFDLLVMNKNKRYLNSENNVYSTNPAAIFGNGWIRFVGAAQEWGRDTGVDGVISNFPLLVSGRNVVFGGNSDPKQGSRGNRSFVANNGTTVYIGVVYNATVAESAQVLKAMNMENGLNLDSGGSTALWFGGYKTGPGRNIPNAILFVRK